jgi:hypothetical protein
MPERMVDAIREGKAPEVVRRKAAEGGLPVPVGETIEILVYLSRDKDEDIRTKALDTLYNWDRQQLQQTLANPATPPGVLDFATNYLASDREDLLEALINNPNLPDDLRDEITSNLLRAAQQAAASPSQPPELPRPVEPAAAETPGQQPPDKETLIQKVNRMSAVEKIKTALTGNQEARMLLIRDSNKLVARAVLQSPKLSDSEVEGYASAKNVSEEVLRLIAGNRAFRKSYTVMRALINNPRAPIDITLPLLNRMNERDIKMLTQNRNVAESLRSMAVKIIKAKQEASKPKLPGKH